MPCGHDTFTWQLVRTRELSKLPGHLDLSAIMEFTMLLCAQTDGRNSISCGQ